MSSSSPVLDVCAATDLSHAPHRPVAVDEIRQAK